MISRYFVILATFGVAAYRLSQGAIAPAVGAAALGVGLILLQRSSTRPHLRWMAWASFGVTAIIILMQLVQMRTAA